MNLRHTLIIAGLVASSAAAEDSSVSPDFDLPATDLSSTLADGGFELGDVEFTGNPAAGAFDWWPDDLVIAPIPGYSPQLGWTLALAGGYFLTEQQEDGPPPSALGGFVFGSGNGSYAFGLGGKFHLRDDRFRLKAGAGYMDIRYRYYGQGDFENELGISLDILQRGPLYFGSGSVRVWRKLYLGLGYVTGSVEARPRISSDESSFLDIGLDVEVAAVTLPLEWDSRDHEQFPRSGWYAKARSMLYRKDVGSDFDADTFEVEVNRYLPMGEADVLALRAYTRSASGNPPFFLLSTFGGSTDLRGYPAGRYRDRKMYAVQGEYRWQVSDQWILTGFAGVGEVAADWGAMGRNFLPAGGIGVRRVLSQKHRVSLSADVATGRDGTEFYFGVGEAF